MFNSKEIAIKTETIVLFAIILFIVLTYITSFTNSTSKTIKNYSHNKIVFLYKFLNQDVL
jgi:hypothetical protein